MATRDLKLVDPGTLPRPGPIGRVARLLFAVLCIGYVIGLMDATDSLRSADGRIRALVWNGLLPTLFLVSYVINIGFSRAWGKRPAAVCGASIIAAAGIGYLLHGVVETQILARAIWLWEAYVFAHLGLAFLIASLLGTPGCEMRAFHDIYSKLTGIPTQEHCCPIGPLHPIDQWEARLGKRYPQ